MSLTDLRLELEAGHVGTTEAIELSLEAIAGDRLNAFVQGRLEALDEGTGRGPLAGVPIAVKDMFVDDDRVPTAGSNVGGHWLTGTAEVVRRLRRAGAAIVAYTNLHEWGIGTSSAITATGPIANPVDASRIAGGSSGGSAVALATHCVAGALGTDAGGSIRIPAACCGVVGLKPTFGLVPTEGFTGHGGVFDHVGPMARTVGDVRMLLEILTSRPVAPVTDVSDLRVGVARVFFCDDLDVGVRAVLDDTASLLGSIVEDVRAVDLSDVADARKASPVLLVPRWAEKLAHEIRDRPELFQPETHAELERALHTTPESRAKAEAIVTRVVDAWARVFADVDVVLTPTIPIPPPLIADVQTGTVDVDRTFIPLNAPMNVAGVPSMSLPCGVSDGLPVGLTLTAARGRDGVLLDLGESLETALRGRVASD